MSCDICNCQWISEYKDVEHGCPKCRERAEYGIDAVCQNGLLVIMGDEVDVLWVSSFACAAKRSCQKI